MTNTKCSLDYWRKIFSCTKADIFELIDKAILVAAMDYPNEFNDRKDLILQKLYNPLETQGVGEVMRIKEILINNQNETDSILFDSLNTLQLMNLSVETLKATEIGRPVNALRKHNSKQIQKLAQTLVNGWRKLVDECVQSAIIDSGHGCPSKLPSEQDPSCHFSEKERKASNNPQNNSQKSNEISDMAKIEITKRKLIEGYQRVEQAKKQRMVKIIDPRDLPMDLHEKRRPKKKR